jgi:hypothetical protein
MGVWRYRFTCANTLDHSESHTSLHESDMKILIQCDHLVKGIRPSIQKMPKEQWRLLGIKKILLTYKLLKCSDKYGVKMSKLRHMNNICRRICGSTRYIRLQLLTCFVISDKYVNLCVKTKRGMRKPWNKAFRDSMRTTSPIIYMRVDTGSLPFEKLAEFAWGKAGEELY